MNLSEHLAREIARVGALRHIYRSLAAIPGPGANSKLTLAMIDAALERAFAEAGSGDALTQMDAVKELGGFRE